MLKFTEKKSKESSEDGPIETTVTLPWELRRKSRLKVKLDSGKEAGLLLNRGEILRHRDRLKTHEGYTIEVMAASEMVSTAHAASARQLNLACYHLGNRHIELEIGDNWVRYLHDHVLDEMVKGLGLSINTEMLPFEPETGAYWHSHHNHAH